MTVLERLQQLLPELSRGERKAAEYLLKYPYDVQRYGGESIAQSAGVSRSVLIRLSQKLGYTGFAELRFALTHEKEQAPAVVGGGTALDRYAAALAEMRALEGSAPMRQIADAVLHANRVLVLGQYHSYYSAQQMAFRLNRNGIDAHELSDTTRMENYTHILKAGDVVLIFSITGLDSYCPLVEEFLKNRVKVVLITMNEASRVAKLVDQKIVLPQVTHFDNAYLLDDAPTFYLFIEMLIGAMQAKGPA